MLAFAESGPMLLADFVSHLVRRFPDGATLLSADVTLLGNGYPSGIVETVSFEAEDEDEDPEGGEKVDARSSHLHLAA